MRSRRLGAAFLAVSLAAWAAADDRQGTLAKARELARGGNAAAAAELYQDLYESSPSDLSLRFQLAVARHMAGEFEAALDHSRAVVAARPEFAQGWLFVGAAFLQTGEPSEAVEPLLTALRLGVADPNANLMLGEALLQTGRQRGAAVRFLEASEALEQSPRVWYGLERSCTSLVREVIAELGRAPATAAYADALAGDRERRLGRPIAAAIAYRSALERDPSLTDARLSLAAIYREHERPDWAEIEERAARQTPIVECDGFPAQCAYRDGRAADLLAADAADGPARYWQARAAADLAEMSRRRLAESPPTSEHFELLARDLDERGRSLAASRQWRRALELSPENVSLKRGLAASLRLGRDCTAATPLLEQLLAHEPLSADLHFLQGDCALMLERPRQAATLLARALELDPTLTPAAAALGTAYVRLREYESALEPLLEASGADRDGGIHYQLARAYRGLGRPAQARTALEAHRRLRSEAMDRTRADRGRAMPPPPSEIK